MAVFTRLRVMFDKAYSLLSMVFRTRRMATSIEERQRLERDNGVVRSPRRTGLRRSLGQPPADNLRFYVMFVSLGTLFLSLIGFTVRLRNGFGLNDLAVLLMCALGATASYFGWTGWYNAQWKYRWYPLFAVVALVLTFSTLFIVRTEK